MLRTVYSKNHWIDWQCALVTSDSDPRWCHCSHRLLNVKNLCGLWRVKCTATLYTFGKKCVFPFPPFEPHYEWNKARCKSHSLTSNMGCQMLRTPGNWRETACLNHLKINEKEGTFITSLSWGGPTFSSWLDSEVSSPYLPWTNWYWFARIILTGQDPTYEIQQRYSCKRFFS